MLLAGSTNKTLSTVNDIISEMRKNDALEYANSLKKYAMAADYGDGNLRAQANKEMGVGVNGLWDRIKALVNNPDPMQSNIVNNQQDMPRYNVNDEQRRLLDSMRAESGQSMADYAKATATDPSMQRYAGSNEGLRRLNDIVNNKGNGIKIAPDAKNYDMTTEEGKNKYITDLIANKDNKIAEIANVKSSMGKANAQNKSYKYAEDAQLIKKLQDRGLLDTNLRGSEADMRQQNYDLAMTMINHYGVNSKQARDIEEKWLRAESSIDKYWGMKTPKGRSLLPSGGGAKENNTKQMTINFTDSAGNPIQENIPVDEKYYKDKKYADKKVVEWLSQKYGADEVKRILGSYSVEGLADNQVTNDQSIVTGKQIGRAHV